MTTDSTTAKDNQPKPLSERVVEVSPYFAAREFDLATGDLEAYARTCGRMVLRQMATAATSTDVKARILAYINGTSA